MQAVYHQFPKYLMAISLKEKPNNPTNQHSQYTQRYSFPIRQQQPNQKQIPQNLPRPIQPLQGHTLRWHGANELTKHRYGFATVQNMPKLPQPQRTRRIGNKNRTQHRKQTHERRRERYDIQNHRDNQ